LIPSTLISRSPETLRPRMIKLLSERYPDHHMASGMPIAASAFATIKPMASGIAKPAPEIGEGAVESFGAARDSDLSVPCGVHSNGQTYAFASVNR
jgi:hypothetical protein